MKNPIRKTYSILKKENHRICLYYMICVGLLMGLFLYNQELLYEIKIKKPWFNPLLIFACCSFTLLIFFYRHVNYVIPCFLAIAIFLNLTWLIYLKIDNHMSLKYLSDDRLHTLMQNCPNDLGLIPVYVVISDFWKNGRIIISPEILESNGFSIDKLKAWGRLRKVDVMAYPHNMENDEAVRLLALKHIELEASGRKYFIILDNNSVVSSKTIIMQNNNNRVFIGTTEALRINKSLFNR